MSFYLACKSGGFRMTIRWCAVLLRLGLVLGGISGGGDLRAAPPADLPRDLLATTPQDFQRTATVKDDALEVAATITTQPGYQEKHGLLRIVWSDVFLRAFVDKSNGAVTYQVYQKILYVGRYYKYFDIVNYETPAGPKSVEAVNLGRSEECSRSQLFGGCTRIENLAVPIDEALLRTVATRYAPGSDGAWHLRFKAQSGEDFNSEIVPAEVAGLLAAVADYKRGYGLAKSGG